MTAPEFSRVIDVRQAEGRTVRLEATEAERAALAARFELIHIALFAVDLTILRDGEAVLARGSLRATVIQNCAVSGEELTVEIDEPISLRFVPATAAGSMRDDVELDAEACDDIEFTGTVIDLGEAAAQALSLAIDPFATGPEADRVRQEAGIIAADASNPFAVLSRLAMPADGSSPPPRRRS